MNMNSAVSEPRSEVKIADEAIRVSSGLVCRGGPYLQESGRLARFLHFLDSIRRRSALATGDESTEEIQEHEYSPKCRTADTASTLSSNHGREIAAREIP